MSDDDSSTPNAVHTICVCCKKPIHYYVWLARGQNKTLGDFVAPKLPVCCSCRSRAVEIGIRKTHV